MHRSVEEAFVPFSSKFEGVVPWMYQDIKGLVTVAIGNLIDPMVHALVLPFVRPDGSRATKEEIAAEWQAVKAHPLLAKHGHIAARSVTRLRLTDEGIVEVVLQKLHQFESALCQRFPGFDDWPADAQLATLSMAWACGPGFRFPTLAAALNDRDFDLAAKSCHMNETGNPGLIPRNKANKIMYRNAAKVQAWKLDPESLSWPAELVEIQPAEPAAVVQTSFDIVHAYPENEPRKIEPDDA